MIVLPPALLPDHNTPRPFGPSYWVVPGRLLAGPSPDLPDPAMRHELAAAMVECGVRGIVDLMEEGEIPLAAPSVSALLADRLRARFSIEALFHRGSIPDMSVPTPEGMAHLLDAIDAMLSRTDSALYIHCRGGFGRTGTAVGCWLARHGYARGEDALALLAELRAPSLHARYPSPETEAQREMVRGWREGARSEK